MLCEAALGGRIPKITGKHFDGNSECRVRRPRPRVPSDQDRTMIAGSQRDEPVVSRSSGDAIVREFPVRFPRGGRRQNQWLNEVLINQCDSVRRRNARVPRQPGEDRVRLRQGVTAQAQRAPTRPLSDRKMAFMRRDQQRHSDARVHR
jgi:hypothetical protein